MSDPAGNIAVIAAASRQGSRPVCADAAAHRITPDQVATAVVDGIGSVPEVAALARLCADAAVRIAVQRGAVAAILTAASLAQAPAMDGDPDADAVAAVAVTDRDGTVVAWVGDCRGWTWTPAGGLRCWTTDHTVGQQLRVNGAPWNVAADHDNWVRTSLGHATVASVYEVVIPTDAGLLLLTTDGVHDTLGEDRLTEIVAAHADDLDALVGAVVDAVPDGEDGDRDDATIIVIRPLVDPSAWSRR